MRGILRLLGQPIDEGRGRARRHIVGIARLAVAAQLLIGEAFKVELGRPGLRQILQRLGGDIAQGEPRLGAPGDRRIALARQANLGADDGARQVDRIESAGG